MLSLASALWMASAQLAPAALHGDAPRITIDPCVEADRAELDRLVQVELATARASASSAGKAAPPQGAQPLAEIAVTCGAEPDIVYVHDRRTPHAKPRLLDLRAHGAVARKARARELSLVIAELLRDVQSDRSERAGPQPAPAARRAPRPSPPRAELGLLATGEKYAGGYEQAGVLLHLHWLALRPLVLELRLGARAAPKLEAAAGEIASASFAGAAGAGLDALPREHRAGLRVLGRIELAWIHVQGESNSESTAGRRASGLAVLGSLASCAWIALGSRARLLAEPALLLPIRTLSINDRGASVARMAGLGGAASLGLAIQL
jgi:hypothetical protein